MAEKLPSFEQDLKGLVNTTFRDAKSLATIIPPALNSYGKNSFFGNGEMRVIPRNKDVDPKQTIFFDHGYGGNNFTQPVLELLSEFGYEVHAHVKPFLSDIRKQADLSSRQLLRTSHHADEIVMMGHSMGGITQAQVAKNYFVPKNVSKMISLASPYLGTLLACIGPGKSARQMEPGNKFALDLYKKDLPKGLELTCLVPSFDNIVSAESGLDHRAINVIYERYNHLSIIESYRMAKWIDHVIQKDHDYFKEFSTHRDFTPSLQRRLQRGLPDVVRKKVGLVRLYEEFDKHQHDILTAHKYERESGFNPHN